jgi:Ca2+-binding RTX toxin-like protein
VGLQPASLFLFPADRPKAATAAVCRRRTTGRSRTLTVLDSSGRDTVFGAGGGNDTLLGQEGLDRLRGGSGADSLHGGLGADSLFGEAGDDVLFFDIADLAVLGGSGMDTRIGNATADSVQFDAARFQFGAERASIEEVHLGNGNDIFNNYSDPSGFAQLNSDGVTVYGGSGSDRISMRGAGAVSGTEDFVDGGRRP